MCEECKIGDIHPADSDSNKRRMSKEETKKLDSHICPHCGRCPNCGRPNEYWILPYPYYPNVQAYPLFPYQPGNVYY